MATLTFAGCAAQAPPHATVGVYRGRGGVEVQLERDGKGRFLDIPAQAVLGAGEPVTGPIEWSATDRPDGALDLRFYGSTGIRPGTYEGSGMSAVYRAGRRPAIQFTIGDPDEGHDLVLTLVED
ncbi:hypothetical protein ACTJKO_01365 [Curtobacterium sp. 22159]|uniref:hypothetical protein n=1 Tax=Curtobacterium sp. 22159 TaxID=3453882 RepID=UPI003F841C64